MLLACDAALRVFVHGPDGSPRDTGRLHRLITTGLRRLVEDRDGGCRYPGCPRRRHLHAHHIKHWADGGTTDLDNLILLCSFHHRLVHQFAYTIAVMAPGVFAFDRPDGSRIEPAPAIAGHGRLDELPTALHQAPPVTSSTTTPSWAGERVDLGYVVSFLITDNITDDITDDITEDDEPRLTVSEATAAA